MGRVTFHFDAICAHAPAARDRRCWGSVQPIGENAEENIVGTIFGNLGQFKMLEHVPENIVLLGDML
jgi:hypothetical protein